MKGSHVALIIVAIILIGIVSMGGYLIGSYNSLVDTQEVVDKTKSDIDVQLERRADLIPNLVNTVKGYVKHEEAVIESVTKARENLLKANSMSEKAERDEELTSAINALMVVVENYPNLKADASFKQLMDELAGTENRIAIARKNYNNAVKTYNQKTKRFPTNIMASIFNFEEAEYFEAKESSKETPNVNFEN